MARNMKVVVCLLTLSMVSTFPSEDVLILKTGEFQSSIMENYYFVLFCKPKSTRCGRMTPIWDELDHVYSSEDSAVTIAQVDCAAETALCESQRVTEVPVLRFFFKQYDAFQDQQGRRTLETLHMFVEEQIHRADNVTVGGLPDAVIELDRDSFKPFVSERLHLVQFYTPWCAHCKLLAPTWHDLAIAVGGSTNLFISQVDCSKASDLCAEHNIKSYPSLLLFLNGTKMEKYEGNRILDDLTEYVLKKLDEYVPEVDPEVHYESRIAVLTEETFPHVVNNHLVFVSFYTPWCARCKELKPVWEELAESNKDRRIMLASLNCEEHVHICEAQSISVYPTLVLYHEGVHLTDYEEDQTISALQQFIDRFTGGVHDEL